MEDKRTAEEEAAIVLEELEKEHQQIREKYKGQMGIDKGSSEIKKATQNAMRKIEQIREKYGISENNAGRSEKGSRKNIQRI